MIENFEERYAQLLEDIDEDSCVMPLPILSQSVITSKNDIDHKKNVFVMRYCLENVLEV